MPIGTNAQERQVMGSSGPARGFSVTKSSESTFRTDALTFACLVIAGVVVVWMVAVGW